MKNLVSNILGIVLICLATYGLLYSELDIVKYSILNAVGFATFYFENDTIKDYTKKVLDKFIK